MAQAPTDQSSTYCLELGSVLSFGHVILGCSNWSIWPASIDHQPNAYGTNSNEECISRSLRAVLPVIIHVARGSQPPRSWRLLCTPGQESSYLPSLMDYRDGPGPEDNRLTKRHEKNNRFPSCQWEFQDPKMEVPYHISGHIL